MARKKLRANFTLRPDVKKKWLAALRSGKYKQTKGRLYAFGGYCCLGVLCKVLGEEDAELVGKSYPQRLYNFAELFSLPKNRWPSWDSWSVPYKGKMVDLDALNDHEGLSFKQIANVIEHTVETH